MRRRVLHVLEALEGGTARHLVDVVTHVTDVDHEVAVPRERVGSLTDTRAHGLLAEAGAVVHVVPMRRTPWSPPNGPALWSLARLVRSRRPDVVHAHSSIGGLLGRLAAGACRVPCVYTPHGITDVRVGRVAERGLRPLTARLVAVSPSEGRLALDLGLIRSDRLVVIPNAVSEEEPPPVDLRGQLGLSEGTPLVGTIARLVPQKAPEQLIASWALVADAVPEARFVLIGGGELAVEVDAAIVAAGLAERVTRLEDLPGAAGALPQLDVFVLSSRFEGGPYAPLEAMRAGTPVVLTAVVGNRDVVEDGVTGLLVPPEDPHAMASAVVGLLRDEDRRNALGRAGREQVLAHHRLDVMARRLAEVYAGTSPGSTA